MANAPARARASWSSAAKRTFRDITEANPDLDHARLTALYAACDLLSEADEMQKVCGQSTRTQ